MIIVNLNNALKVGKTCDNYRIYAGEHDWGNTFKCDFINALAMNQISFEKFVQAVLQGQSIYENIRVKKGESKGVKTFSPFVEVKPIKIPEKWSLPHVWKAILAGQIKTAIKEMHLTDDYAYDAAVNFGKGEIDSLELAQEIVESPSGWWVRAEEEKNGVIALSVNCHHFDYNKLYFQINQRKSIDCVELAG